MIHETALRIAFVDEDIFSITLDYFNKCMLVCIYSVQDQQLCLFLKLQVLSAVSPILVDILSVRLLHITAVLHQVLAGKTLNCPVLFSLSDIC